MTTSRKHASCSFTFLANFFSTLMPSGNTLHGVEEGGRGVLGECRARHAAGVQQQNHVQEATGPGSEVLLVVPCVCL